MNSERSVAMLDCCFLSNLLKDWVVNLVIRCVIENVLAGSRGGEDCSMTITLRCEVVDTDVA